MFIIEGMIGAGKSTFLQLLQKNMPTISVNLEPVHTWETQVYGQSLLSQFYQDTHRWAYTFELMTLMHRVHDYQMLQKNTPKNLFIERSFYSGYYCFAYNSFLQGFMSSLEWNLYKQWFDFLIMQKHHNVQGFVYLRVDPSVAYERIRKRSRCAEQTVSFDYTMQIYQRHEEFLITRHNVHDSLSAVPVLVLDVNNDFEHNECAMDDFVMQISDFVKSATK